MKFTILPLLALAALPTLAQDRWQAALGFNQIDTERQDYFTASGIGAGAMATFKRESATAPSLQLGYRIKDFTSSDLVLTGEYQFEKTYGAKATAIGVSPGRSIITQEDGKIRKSFFAPGIMWNWHPVVDLGIGLQYRFERLKADFVDIGVCADYDRPWLNATVGYTFRTGARVRPFVALRTSAALVTTKAPDRVDDLPRMLKSVAGDAEACLQLGVRF